MMVSMTVEGPMPVAAVANRQTYEPSEIELRSSEWRSAQLVQFIS